MDMPKIGIITAMPREVAGLVRNWRSVTLGSRGRNWNAFQTERAVLVCAGIGPLPAGRAAEAVAKQGVEVLISAGFAGALVPRMRAGAPFTPEVVVDAETGARFRAVFGGGVLVSATRVLREEEKSDLAHKYDAQCVDMEAATVAAVADRHGCGFLAVKAISDTLGFPLPPVEPFIDPEGRFQEAKFVGHVALRPHLWRSVARLAANQRKAAQTICGVLDAILQIDDLRSVRGKLRPSMKFL
jgi:adenosylhomocysteine nucleosidase